MLRPYPRHLLALVAVLTALTVAALPPGPAGAEPRPDEVPAAAKPDARLAEKLAAVRDARKVPAVFGAIVAGDGLRAAAAVGVRKADADEPVTVDDKIHLGSNTKAMTATLIAVLIEKKKLGWDSTVGGVLPDLKGKVHADYLGVTLRQLLAHEGGVVPNVLWWAAPQDESTRAQRSALLPVILKDAPADKPGTKYRYSNASYVVAAAMAEAAADRSWEDLMTAELFKPLGMASAGFGPPGVKGRVDQPWGHTFSRTRFEPTRRDNPPVLGPAGTVHVSLSDWAKFAALHLRGAKDKEKGKLIGPASFAKLHTPTDGFAYAGGWLVDADGHLAHAGSNGSWYALVRILPERNLALLVAVNAGGDEGGEALEAAEKVLDEYARDRFGKK
jgi:CubicO group peptidase (beta-lactamase class C family)